MYTLLFQKTCTSKYYTVDFCKVIDIDDLCLNNN